MHRMKLLTRIAEVLKAMADGRGRTTSTASSRASGALRILSVVAAVRRNAPTLFRPQLVGLVESCSTGRTCRRRRTKASAIAGNVCAPGAAGRRRPADDHRGSGNRGPSNVRAAEDLTAEGIMLNDQDRRRDCDRLFPRFATWGRPGHQLLERASALDQVRSFAQPVLRRAALRTASRARHRLRPSDSSEAACTP